MAARAGLPDPAVLPPDRGQRRRERRRGRLDRWRRWWRSGRDKRRRHIRRWERRCGSRAGGRRRGPAAGGTGGSAAGRGGGSAGSGAIAGSGGTAGAAGAAQGGAVIINDRFWQDTSGTPIYSQGGGVLQVGDTYYWYGVKYRGAVTYAANPTGKNNDTSFAGITIYSSKNLADWKLENTVMPANTGGWFGRLGVVYHAATQKYVLVAQGGGGLYFATSSTPAGTFVYNNVQRDLPGIVNGATGDQTMFQDDDGQAYLISSSSSGRANRYVSPLRASDFLAVENAVFVYKGGGRKETACSSTTATTTTAHRICTAGTPPRATASPRPTSAVPTAPNS